jgi:GTP pyrophosphokinase
MAFSSRFEEALAFAAHLHRDQVRKGTQVPYVAHLLGAAGIALEHGADEDQAIAALLHDAVEDQGGAATLEVIRERFGEDVAAIVAACTDTDATPKPPWRQRKEAYISHLATAPAAARLVSTADKLHNARAILADYRTAGESVWSRFSGGREGTLWYYRALVTAFQSSGSLPLVEELNRVVSEIEALAAANPPRDECVVEEPTDRVTTKVE